MLLILILSWLLIIGHTREEAAYPAKFLKVNKFWPPVARVDNVYGDKNIFCTCPSMDEFKEDAA